MKLPTSGSGSIDDPYNNILCVRSSGEDSLPWIAITLEIQLPISHLSLLFSLGAVVDWQSESEFRFREWPA